MPTPAKPTSPSYIWQHPAWPQLIFDAAALAPALDQARLEQGRLLGLLSAIGLEQANAVQRELWVQEALATAAIEGEKLNVESLRSSVAHRLQLADAPGADRSVDGLVQVMGDALANHSSTLCLDRLCRWQSALFPGGTSGIARIAVGRVRDHADAMQIVSGALGREVVHYEAPPSAQVAAEMARLLAWFESTRPTAGPSAINGIARAALAHLWFESIHPFEDGNGRIGRAVVELALAQDMQSPQRLMSVSTQLLHARADYYAQLQAATGRAELEVTPWVQWFATRVQGACEAATQHIQGALEKTRFWSRVQAEHSGLSASQHRALGRLFDAGPQGFVGGLSTEKYVNLTGVSRATAYRELTQLTELGLLVRTGQGRGTRYGLAGDAGLLSHE